MRKGRDRLRDVDYEYFREWPSVWCVIVLLLLQAIGDLLSASPMSDINTPTATDTISNEIPIPVDSDPASSSIPENVSETLYIQNLNEMIRIDGSPL
jgi:hypothetical protein